MSSCLHDWGMIGVLGESVCWRVDTSPPPPLLSKLEYQNRILEHLKTMSEN